MTKRKIITALITTLMTMSLLVGCSANELTYYRISNTLANWQINEAIHTEGEIALTINEVSDALTDGGDEEMIETAYDYINNHKLMYAMDSDLQNGKYTGTIDLLKLDTKDTIPLFTFMREDKLTYVKMDDYLAFIKHVVTDFTDEEYANDFNAGMYAVFEDLEYIKISDTEVLDFYKSLIEDSVGTAPELDLTFEQLEEQYTNPSIANQKRELSKDFMDLLAEDVYDNLSLNLVDKKGGKYIVTIDADNLGDSLFNYAEYNLDNSDNLIDTIKGYVNGLSDEEYTLLVGYAAQKMTQEMILEELDSAAADISENREEYRAELVTFLEAYNTMYKAYIDGSILTHSLEQSNNTITSEFQLDVVVNDLITESPMVSVSLTATEETKKIGSVKVNLPTENVQSFKDVVAAIPTVMEIHLPSNTYTITGYGNGFDTDFGYIDIVVQEGRSYLPMRMIGEKLGEEIMWDDQLRKPYFSVDGKSIYVDEYILVDSTSYIKTREFEKIDYFIDWDPETRTISISK